MILTLSAKWQIDPNGPLRKAEQAEDLWSVINAVGSLMSGEPLFPWFLGESNEDGLLFDGSPEDLVLEFYSAEHAKPSAVEFLPAIMLATDIALRNAFSTFDLANVRLSLHPGEQSCALSRPWWDNYFNQSRGGTRHLVKLAPALPDIGHAAQSACPNLFSVEGDNLIAGSWGLVECAVLVAVVTSVMPVWSTLAIESRLLAPDHPVSSSDATIAKQQKMKASSTITDSLRD
ncbi:hypothetical protein [Corynebacterium gerontici]|uniref:Uncharacterized protein n=1 Tax=Corynebacterium gerontici TaxID=2079234 RepID=A0A3G6J4A4_9CORY|nr:hypothetical protein [Corynebacterium gerontici]AZA10904.1 hypothetical protein CGERO_02905 [Corynebacterium gerontici]